VSTNAPLLGEPVPVELMNTIWADRDGVHDELATADGTLAWLSAIAPRTDLTFTGDFDGMSAADAESFGIRLQRLRDALRRLAGDTTEDPRPAASSPVGDLASAVGEVNRAAAVAPRWSALDWPHGQAPTRVAQAAKPTSQALISEIADNAIDLFASAQRTQLKACLAPGCVLYFVKNHPRREWCSAGCGNRARVARHYRRHHAAN
jgi:putative stress-induced transcription regulator/CGNR zinc finger protein